MSESQPRALCSVDAFMEADLDYLVIGGGTSGLVVAARLSEDPKVRVGVLEAGSANLNDPALLVPAGFAALLESPVYSWSLKTAPQPGTNNVSHSFPRGKGLGGSSAINLMQYVRGQRAEYDDWNLLTGYKTWGWDDLKPYFMKYEGCQGPDANGKIEDVPFRFDASHHGVSGPIRTSFPSWMSPLERDWHRAAKGLEIGWDGSLDAWSGNNLGGFPTLGTVDRSVVPASRSYSTTGYFLPNKDRPNLFVLVEATAAKVVLERGNDASVRARGAVFFKDGQKYTKTVGREVILAAGVVQTPQLLELSGVGARHRLESLDIEVFVDSDQVGEGLEDHTATTTAFEIRQEVFTSDWLSRPDILQKATQDYQSGKGGPLDNVVPSAALMSLAQVATKEEMEAIKAAVQETLQNSNDLTVTQREFAAKRLMDPKAANFQYILNTAAMDTSHQDSLDGIFLHGTNGLSPIVVLTHPLSRGSIHITSSDPMVQPRIDPQYLQHPVDALVLAVGIRLTNDIVNTSPLKENVIRRISPDPSVDMRDLEALKEHVHRTSLSCYHPIGTAALGRVVDERLKVMGVEGLRAIDASIFPLHVSGNIISIVYAVAEKAADMIKEDAA